MGFLFILLAGTAQNYKYMDSLRKVIPLKSDFDTTKAKLLNNLAFEYSYVDLDSGMRIAMKAMEISKNTNNSYAIANVYNTMATIYHDQGNYQKAVECYSMARKYAESTNDKRMLAVIYANLGNTYSSIGDFEGARHYLFESNHLFRELKETWRFPGSYLNIGIIYAEHGNLDSAMYYYKEALKFSDIDEGILANLHSSMASALRQKNELEEAEKELIIALEIAHKLKSDYYSTSYSISLADLYITRGKYKEAEELLRTALAFAKKDGLLSAEVDANYNLYKLYVAQKQYSKALEYHEYYTTLSDSINNKERNNAARELEKKYQSEKKQAVIEKLNAEKESSVRESTRKGQLLIVSFIGVAIAIFSIIKTRSANKRLQSLNKKVLQQKDELQDKNKNITDSIHYAQRIQNVLLTSQGYIRESLPEFFILNKPKDIVSGDFYWAIHLDNKFYFQVADCTGHGVPGAFMSLLGISFLNEIVLERRLEQPNEILNQLRAEIKKVFTDKENQDNQMNDGMDCVLCKFDLQSNLLQYAAANNSSIVIRNGEVIQLSGDKMPVGKSPRDTESFSLHTFQLQKGDLVYMFSDGYPDQFGGPQGKKLKVKNVKQLLLSIAMHSMEEQRNLLNEQFEKWRGSLEQVDDVLVVGIRI